MRRLSVEKKFNNKFLPIAISISFFLSIACGANNRESSAAFTTSAQVDFAFELKGETHRVSELRGRPLVLVLMRTSDLPSQIYMDEVVRAFSMIAGRTRFLVLSVEQSELPFVGPYAEFEKLPFAIGVAEPAVGLGKTELGEVPIVPMTYILDAEGRVTDAAAGNVKAEETVRIVESL